MYRICTYTHLDSDGRKFDLSRKQVGLSKKELARQHGISRQSLYRCIWDGSPRLGALVVLWLWIPGSHRELFEELSESEEGMTRRPKGRQGIRCAKKKDLKFLLRCNYKLHIATPAHAFTRAATQVFKPFDGRWGLTSLLCHSYLLLPHKKL